jgi:hypothetical protein
VTDLAPLLRFRAATIRGRARVGVPAAFGLILVVTVAAAWLPGYVVAPRFPPQDVLIVLPSGFLGVLVISIVSAIATGGGRELVHREHAVAFPVSATTDHLGALLMAPLNIAWLLQSWALLAMTAYGIGPRPSLLAAQVPVLLWLAAATATAQLFAWSVEWVRRGPAGRLLVRTGTVLAAAQLGYLIFTGRLAPLLDRSPTLRLTLGVIAGSRGEWGAWLGVVGRLVVLVVLAVVLGAYVNRGVVRRPARDEARVETAVQPARPNPTSDFIALLRVDRAGVWRSVPLRRGLAVLAILPGLVAIASALQWNMLCLMPGLVASGGALLFGVNAWCLDGRGALWRDSLPAAPRLAFLARLLTLAEVLLVAIALTLAMASLRAGAPTGSQTVAVLCSALVVTFQVVSGSLRWSVRRPFAVDLRGSRATPAPPLVMVGYSTRLALSTTVTGLLFAAASLEPVGWSLLLAVPFLASSALRLHRTAAAWSDPGTRARVVATVAS